MIFIRDKLTYEEVQSRFEKQGYKLLSTEYKNAKSHLNVLCPLGHEWTDKVKPEWLAKLDEMRKSLKSAKRRTYRE